MHSTHGLLSMSFCRFRFILFYFILFILFFYLFFFGLSSARISLSSLRKQQPLEELLSAALKLCVVSCFEISYTGLFCTRFRTAIFLDLTNLIFILSLCIFYLFSLCCHRFSPFFSITGNEQPGCNFVYFRSAYATCLTSAKSITESYQRWFELWYTYLAFIDRQ